LHHVAKPTNSKLVQAVCHNLLRRILLPQVQIQGELVDFKNELSWYVHSKHRVGNVGGGDMEEEEEDKKKGEEEEEEDEVEAEMVSSRRRTVSASDLPER